MPSLKINPFWQDTTVDGNLYFNILRNASERVKDLGMACHTPPLNKAKKQGEMPLPSLVTAFPLVPLLF